MPFEWADYSTLAEWLTAHSRTELSVAPEAALRSAVSRAYYASFNQALALLVRKNEFTPSGRGTDHGEVLRLYRTHATEPRKQVGVWLDRLRERRRLADYDAAATIPPAMAQASVEYAKQIRTYLAAM